MGELTSTLDSLGGDDLKPMFGSQLLDRLGELLIAQNRIAAEVARAVRECELTQACEHDGLKTMQSWLRGHGRLSSAAASRTVHSGRALEHLPAVAAAFVAGVMTAEAVGVIAPIATPERLAAAADQDVDLPVIESHLVAVAAEQSHDQLRQVVARYQAALDPDGPEPDPTEGRRLSLAKHAEGGSGRFELDTVGFEQVQASLESLVQANRPEGDMRTRSQQLADALVQLCDNALASGDLPFLRTVKPQVIVTIRSKTWSTPPPGPERRPPGSGRCSPPRGPGGWPATPASPASSSTPTASHWTSAAPSDWSLPGSVRRWRSATGTASSPAAPPPPTGATSTRPPPGARGELASRGEGAVLPHTKVHHGFRVERPPDGRWRTYRPDDTEVVIGPRL